MSNYLCIILQLKYITRRIDVMQRSYKVLLSMPTTSNLSNYVYIYIIYTQGSTALILESLRGDSLLFTIKSLKVSVTNFIHIGKNERLSRPWSHPMAFNQGPLNWKSSAP